MHGRSATTVAQVSERIGQMENDQVARMHAQIRRLVTGCICVAITNRPVCIGRIIRGQPHFQNTILAAQVLRFFDHAPRLRAWTFTLGPYQPVREAQNDNSNP